MSAEIVNLRRARKAKARSDKEATAAANRVKFGRPKAEREIVDAKRDLAERRLDGAYREGAPKPDDGSPASKSESEKAPRS